MDQKDDWWINVLVAYFLKKKIFFFNYISLWISQHFKLGEILSEQQISQPVNQVPNSTNKEALINHIYRLIHFGAPLSFQKRVPNESSKSLTFNLHLYHSGRIITHNPLGKLIYLSLWFPFVCSQWLMVLKQSILIHKTFF